MYLDLRGATCSLWLVVYIFDIQHGRYIKLAYLILSVGLLRRFGLRWKLEHLSRLRDRS
jgi:hypothetical protein